MTERLKHILLIFLISVILTSCSIPIFFYRHLNPRTNKQAVLHPYFWENLEFTTEQGSNILVHSFFQRIPRLLDGNNVQKLFIILPKSIYNKGDVLYFQPNLYNVSGYFYSYVPPWWDSDYTNKNLSGKITILEYNDTIIKIKEDIKIKKQRKGYIKKYKGIAIFKKQINN